MGIITKIKSFFFKEDKSWETEVPALETPQAPIPEPKGESIGQCPLCKEIIGSEDRTKELNKMPVHKRCYKRATKGIMNGKKLEEIF